jgi:hypothetical protein
VLGYPEWVGCPGVASNGYGVVSSSHGVASSSYGVAVVYPCSAVQSGWVVRVVEQPESLCAVRHTQPEPVPTAGDIMHLVLV